MDRTATVTILILLLCAIAAKGNPIPVAHEQCKSIQTSFDVIHACERAEVIVTLRNEKKECVHPDAKCLQALLTAMKGGKQHKSKKN
ncbi:C-X-C motif chemokine 9-like [Mobula hypostoma]|uniref:C-X-C motif chemokine 9-like n=1 Tax=Mobula hypostoma TaxID=723540 RepID=UPI002FC2A6A3